MVASEVKVKHPSIVGHEIFLALNYIPDAQNLPSSNSDPGFTPIQCVPASDTEITQPLGLLAQLFGSDHRHDLLR